MSILVLAGSAACALAAAAFAHRMLDHPISGKETAAILIAAVILGASVLKMGRDLPPGTGWIRLFSLFSAFVCAAVFDFYTHRIPNVIPLFLIAVFAVCLLIDTAAGTADLLSALAGGLGAGLITASFLTVCRFLARGGLGYGDVKLMGAAAMTLGLRGTVFLLVFAEVFAFIYAVQAILRKKMNLKGSIPFAPFFLLGFLAAAATGMF